MVDPLFQPTTPEIAARRRELVPGVHDARDQFSNAVFAAGAVSAMAERHIAARAHATLAFDHHHHHHAAESAKEEQ